MIVPDINLLVYAYNPTAPLHRAARAWWEQTLNSGNSVLIPWVVILGFVRLVTSPRVFVEPESPQRACAAVDSWFERPNAVTLDPGPNHRKILFGFLETVGVAGNLTTDAHIAALAIEFEAVVCSTDSDFGRFEGLRWVNPLSEVARFQTPQ